MARRKHPIQPLEFDDNGVIRFRKNRLVNHLLNSYGPGLNDLNYMAQVNDWNEDYEHLMMLIGYSVSGFGDLELNRRTIAVADQMAIRLAKKDR